MPERKEKTMERYRKKVEISDWLRIHMGEVFGDEPPDKFQGQKQEKRRNAGDCSLSAEQQMDLRTPGTCPLPRITALVSESRNRNSAVHTKETSFLPRPLPKREFTTQSTHFKLMRGEAQPNTQYPSCLPSALPTPRQRGQALA